jgi:GT2 family glycosyltransferase
MISVVICTYRRPELLYILLKSLGNQSKLPESIKIVGTNELDFSIAVNNQIIKLQEKGITVEKLFAPKGLTKQRNFGVDHLPADTTIVCFLDDDILIPKNYIELTSNNFINLPDAVGIGFVTHDNLNRKNNVRVWDSISMNNSFKPGKLLKSGVNSGFDYQLKPYKVDWLPGCCMNYRYNIFRHLNFDERRLDTCWGEDVDFSFRAKEFGNLYMISISDLVHTRSKIRRDEVDKIKEFNYKSRVFFAIDKIGSVKLSWIIYSIFLKFNLKFNLRLITLRRVILFCENIYYTKNYTRLNIKKIFVFCIHICDGMFRKFNSLIFNLIAEIKSKLRLIGYVYRIKKELSEKYK